MESIVSCRGRWERSDQEEKSWNRSLLIVQSSIVERPCTVYRAVCVCVFERNVRLNLAVWGCMELLRASDESVSKGCRGVRCRWTS